jgi:phosphopantothenoylcysteine synthetase/decarboxylase
MRVLVTSGGTEEPIDGVRRLTNSSTGATGAVIARTFHGRGADVFLLRAERAPMAADGIAGDTFVTFEDLGAALRRHLAASDWDAVIHLAAVSDYAVASVEVDGVRAPNGDRGKIGSGAELVIRLRPNPKLIDSLKRWSRNRDIQVIGFKLTNDRDPAIRENEIRALLARKSADLVVHNDLTEIAAGRHPAEIWSPRGPLVRTATKEELAEALFGLLHSPDRRPEDRPCPEMTP